MGMFDDLRAEQRAGGDEEAFYQDARARFEAARPDIEAGRLRAYPNWRAAEVALEGLRPKGASPLKPEGPAPRRTMFDELRERNGVQQAAAEQAGMTHHAPGEGYRPLEPPSPVAMAQPNVAGVQRAMQQAQVHSGALPQVPAPAVDPQQLLAQPQPDSSDVAPRGERLAAAGILGAGARVVSELAGAGGANVALRAARPLAGRLLKGAATAAGTAAGSLLAEPVDPSGDPFATAALAATFSGLGDGVALAFSAARKARAARAATRDQRTVPGAQDAVRILGEGNLPTAGRLSTSPGVDVVENIVETSILGGEAVKQRNARAEARATQLIRRFTDRFARGASRQDVDRLVMDVLDQRHGSFYAAGDALYRELDGLAPTGVSTRGLVDLRNSIVNEYRNKAEAPDLEALVQAIDRVLGVPESTEYGTAVVLIGLVLAVNSLSIGLRSYLRSRKKW